MPKKDPLARFIEPIEKTLARRKEEEEKKMGTREYLSRNQVFPYLKDDKLCMKKISYNIDDNILKEIDEQLGKEILKTEGEFEFHESPLAGCALTSKIGQKTMNLAELISFYDNDMNKISNVLKHTNYYVDKDGYIYMVDPYAISNPRLSSSDMKSILFRYTVYRWHPKIYAMVEFTKKRFDLDYIYRNLCRFLDLKYSYYFKDFPTAFHDYEMEYDYSFLDKEMKLSLDEKTKLLRSLFSMINIDELNEMELKLYSQRSDTMSMASCNTKLLNDESFRTIMELVSDTKNIVTSNDEKSDLSCAKVKVRKIKKSDENDF